MTELEKIRERIDGIDAEMAKLFASRMNAVAEVAAYKRAHGLPITDTSREDAVIRKNTARIEDEALRPYYADYLRELMAISKRYQANQNNGDTAKDGAFRTLPVHTPGGEYDIILARGGLSSLSRFFRLDRKVLIVTDDGVPCAYAACVAAQSAHPYIEVLPQGEQSKNIDSYRRLLSRMTREGFTRSDCVVAVGGGVVGDLSGFAAATYMRGIDFYNIPTTVLSQVDSSIGGKTAIDFEGYKNTVGAFYQPKCVLIDPDLLSTLPPRQISNGLAESVKMGLTSDEVLFSLFEKDDPLTRLDEIIYRSLAVKRSVVEQDEKEGGLRKILNFGHTLAHALESEQSFADLYHGECVALGMLPMCEGEVRTRLLAVLRKLSLPTRFRADADTVLAAIRHDKKKDGDAIWLVTVPAVGRYDLSRVPFEEYAERLKDYLSKTTDI